MDNTQTGITTKWLWEETTLGDDRLISVSQMRLKKHIEKKYNEGPNPPYPKITYHTSDDLRTIFVHYGDAEVGFIKKVEVV